MSAQQHFPRRKLVKQKLYFILFPSSFTILDTTVSKKNIVTLSLSLEKAKTSKITLYKVLYVHASAYQCLDLQLNIFKHTMFFLMQCTVTVLTNSTIMTLNTNNSRVAYHPSLGQGYFTYLHWGIKSIGAQ